MKTEPVNSWSLEHVPPPEVHQEMMEYYCRRGPRFFFRGLHGRLIFEPKGEDVATLRRYLVKGEMYKVNFL